MNISFTDLIWFIWLSQEYSKPSSHAGTWLFEYGAFTDSLLQKNWSSVGLVSISEWSNEVVKVQKQ